MGTLTSVCALMNFEIACFTECFATHCTHIWFLSCVNPTVSFECFITGEGLTTHITQEVALAGVATDMEQQGPFVCERLAAGLTLIALRVLS